MTIDAGARLGPYEILAPIGAGGMGEVYKAKDTRLDRTVAIKILPEHLAHSPERKRRFEREAKAISQLNHPHICTLFDVGSQDGIDFLVMEYIEGDTLAEKLKRGALPLDKALEYGSQIADGLDRAHRNGVVHRDLKPGNVMLTKSGVKLLDFGLAKLVEPEPAGDGSDAPTQQRDLTQAQAILGTLPYMAPEQLEAKDVDTRTDIFAFGAVLYEMLTGVRAFKGESQASLISAIMSSDPEPVSVLRSTTPPALDHVIRTCLAKDPEERWQAASDVARQLKWISSGDAQLGPDRVEHKRLPWAIPAALAFVLGGIGVRILMPPPETPPPPVTRFTIDRPAGELGHLARPPLSISPPAVSPDGRFLAIATSDGLLVREMDRFEARLIPDTEGAEVPFFSPDGQWIGYFSFDALYKVRVKGGAPLQISGAPLISGASWGPGGTIVVGQSSSGLLRFSAEGGTSETITNNSTETGEQGHTLPEILPDGENVVFTVETNDQPKVAVASLETGRHRILFDGSNARYLPTGHLVYTQASTLFAVPFDLTSLETFGNPVPVVEGILSELWGKLTTAYFTVSQTGTLVYVPGDQAILREGGPLVWVDRNGRTEPITEVTSNYLYPRLSPNGKQVAASQHREDRDIWLFDLGRRSSMRFTFDGTQYVSVWTPDGERLTYHSDHAGQGLFWQAVDGSGPEEALSVRPDWQFPGGWSPDGTVLAFTEVSFVTKGDIWILPRNGGEPTPFANTSFDERAPVFSPDGRFIAYVSDESGRDEVQIQPFPGPGPKVPVSTGGGREPLWSPNGKELFYRRGYELFVVDVVELSPKLRLGQPRVLFEGRFDWTRVGPPNYDVSRNGRRFVMVELGEDSVPFQTDVNVVLNWFEELKRLVPTE